MCLSLAVAMLKQTLEDKPSNKTLWSLLGPGPRTRQDRSRTWRRKYIQGYGEGVSEHCIEGSSRWWSWIAQWRPGGTKQQASQPLLLLLAICHLTSCHCPYFFPLSLLLVVAYFWNYHCFCYLRNRCQIMAANSK